jgi:ABC-type dipeptide/oligopeptide/nickel transport system permease subunit
MRLNHLSLAVNDGIQGTGGLGFASDEFGRNLLLSTAESLGVSFFEATFSALLATALPLVVVMFAVSRNDATVGHTVRAISKVLDAIPLFFWAALIFSTAGIYGFWGKQIALQLVALPFVVGLIIDRFTEVARLPFLENAKRAGVPLYVRSPTQPP